MKQVFLLEVDPELSEYKLTHVHRIHNKGTLPLLEPGEVKKCGSFGELVKRLVKAVEGK